MMDFHFTINFALEVRKTDVFQGCVYTYRDKAGAGRLGIEA